MKQNHTSQNRRAFCRSLAALLTGFSTIPAWASERSVRFWREYVELQAGSQVHLYNAKPAAANENIRRPLVCFHPTAYSGDFFREFQTLMAIDRHVLCPDTPGFGKSDLPASPPSIADYAGAMIEMLDALGFGKAGRGAVDMLGFHTGCFIATEIAVLRPDLVNRLVLPGIPYMEADERRLAFERNAKVKQYFADPNAVVDMWQEKWQWQGDAVPLPRLLELMGSELHAGPEQWWAYAAVFSYAAEKRLPLVRHPALAIVTEGDLLEPTRQAAALIPRATVAVHEDLPAPLFNRYFGEMNAIVRRYLDTGV